MLGIITLASSLLLPNVQIELLEYGSPFAQCLSTELKKQSPPKMFGEGEAFFSGPQVRRDYQPPNSAYEILVTIPNANPFPRYLTLSLMLESADRKAWQRHDLGNGKYAISTAEMMNPVNVFNRSQMQHLFDFDLSPCVKEKAAANFAF